METKDKIKSRMTTLNLRAVDIVGATGASKGSVSQWLSGSARPGNKYIVSLCALLECDADWLLSEDDSPVRYKTSNAEQLGSFEPWDSATPMSQDEVNLPFFQEVEASAGAGQFEVKENRGLKLRFARSTLQRYNISPENAACIKVKGNSMEPVLPDGSTVGVDTGSKSIIDGKMFAIDHDGMLRVKMLYRTPAGGVRLRSYNSDEHPDETYSKEESQHIRILGRVFWSSVLY